jgi:hypothetical protein
MAKVVTGKARLSYCNIFEARASQEGGDAKYSVSVLIPKSDVATIAAINKAVQATIDEGKASKFGGKIAGLKMPLRDGDTEKDDEAYVGHWFFNASAKQKPVIVDINGNVILDSREVYSGCFGRVSVNFFAYNSNGSKGVAAGLNAVQKTADGESLGGAYTENEAANDFGLAGDDADML